MVILPAIDLKDGKCVRLRQGRADDVTVYGDDPAAQARDWRAQGGQELHVVDLDGAFAGEPRHAETIARIIEAFGGPVEVGGGIRDMDSLRAVLEAGAETFFLTHGHLWNEYRLPPLGMGTVLAHGHTHVPELKRLACGMTIFNPGSVALPKGGSSRSFGYFDGRELRHYTV